jgi:hypothetical protein
VAGLLVLYGIPPIMDIVDRTGRRLGRMFALTAANQASFEDALRRALTTLLRDHLNVALTRLAFVQDANQFTINVKNTKAPHLIYYGQALSDANALLPSLGRAIPTWQIVHALRETSVSDFDILGCSGPRIAAELAVTLPKVRIGYLTSARDDNVEISPATSMVTNLKIDSQQLQHLGAR